MDVTWTVQVFEVDVMKAAERAGLKNSSHRSRRQSSKPLGSAIRMQRFAETARAESEPDSELRDTENIPLPPGTALPLPYRFWAKQA